MNTSNEEALSELIQLLKNILETAQISVKNTEKIEMQIKALEGITETGNSDSNAFSEIAFALISIQKSQQHTLEALKQNSQYSKNRDYTIYAIVLVLFCMVGYLLSR